MASGKKYRAASEKVNREKKYSVEEAFSILPKLKISEKFDESVDLAVRLGVDPRPADRSSKRSIAWTIDHPRSRRSRDRLTCDSRG